MTIEELATRLAAINAFAVIDKGCVRIQVQRDGRNPPDGFFTGSSVETMLAGAEVYASMPTPGDAEYASWNEPAPLLLAARARSMRHMLLRAA